MCSTVLSFKRDQSHACTSKGFVNNFQYLRRSLVSSYREWKRLTHLHSPGQRSGKIARTLVWEAGRSWRWCKSSEEGTKKNHSEPINVTKVIRFQHRCPAERDHPHGSESLREQKWQQSRSLGWTHTSRTCVSGVRRSNRKQITRMSLQYSTSSSGVNFSEEFGVTSLVLFGPTAKKRGGQIQYYTVTTAKSKKPAEQ